MSLILNPVYHYRELISALLQLQGRRTVLSRIVHKKVNAYVDDDQYALCTYVA
jgi:hypothetical protein